MSRAFFFFFFLKGAHFFNVKVARFKVRNSIFLMLYPTEFHKTKYIAYSNMNTTHKHTA